MDNLCTSKTIFEWIVDKFRQLQNYKLEWIVDKHKMHTTARAMTSHISNPRKLHFLPSHGYQVYAVTRTVFVWKVMPEVSPINADRLAVREASNVLPVDLFWIHHKS
jgi:hypothetical protein